MAEEKTQVKHPITETTDILVAADKVLKELKEHKSDDGKLDTLEIVTALKDSSMALMQAAWGSWNVPKEMGDLSEEEAKKLLGIAIPVVWGFVELFMPEEAKKEQK